MPDHLTADDSGAMTVMEADYADFEYQLLSVEPTVTGSGSLNGDIVFATDPLEEQGGLSNNEVAELVAHRLAVGVEFESETGEQQNPSDAETRGLFGANIQTTDTILKHNDKELEVLDTAGDIDTSTGSSGSAELTDNRVFEPFFSYGAAPHGNGQTGAGSNGASSVAIFERNWRRDVGRGPVLDPNDDVTIAARVITGNTSITVRGQIRVHCIWDVAEVDNAERQFSVPE